MLSLWHNEKNVMMQEGLTVAIAVAVISIVFTAWFIPKILIVSFKKRLFDFADERKVHTGIVPRLGGVAFVPSIIISLSFAIGLCALVNGGGTHLRYFNVLQVTFGMCALLLLYFEGIMDDLVGLGYKIKFVFQNVAAALVVVSGVWLNDLHGLFGVYELSPYVGMPLTLLVMVYLINAINLIDGIDGLASGLSIVASFFFGVMFLYVGLWGCAALAFAIFGTLCPFFYYNVFGNADRCRKIFMGDTGSQCIGLLLGYCAIRLSMKEPLMEHNIEGSIIVAFSTLLVPAFDVIRVMIHRARAGRNMFRPDKSHVHHKLLALGIPHKAAMTIILVIAMLFVVLNLILLSYMNINIILLIDIVIWSGLNMILSAMIKKKKTDIQ